MHSGHRGERPDTRSESGDLQSDEPGFAGRWNCVEGQRLWSV